VLGFLLDSAKEESLLLSRTKKEATHPDLLGKEEGGDEDFGKESFQAQHTRDYKSSLLSRLILPEAELEH
jgi:hypothetical protein